MGLVSLPSPDRALIATGSGRRPVRARSSKIKMLAERRTGRLLGVQIVGREGAAKQSTSRPWR